MSKVRPFVLAQWYACLPMSKTATASALSAKAQIDWSGIRAAAITLGSVREAAKRAAANLPPAEAGRFIERVNKRAYRERWIDEAKAIAKTSPTNAKPLSKSVHTGSQLLGNMLKAGENPAILSLVEKRQYLASVVRTPVGEVDERSALAQKVKRRYDKDGASIEEIETPGKLRAIELDARLAGEIDGKSDPANVVVNVALLGVSPE